MRKQFYRVLAASLSLLMFMQSSLIYAAPADSSESVYDSSVYVESESEVIDEPLEEILATELTQKENIDEEPDEKEVAASMLLQEKDDGEEVEGVEPFDLAVYAELEPNESGEIHLQKSEDFVALSNMDASIYQNATIVITRASGENFDLIGQQFLGLGSEEYPFKGSLVVTNGETNDIEIPVDHTFFNYLDQSAKIGTGLYLLVGAEMNSPILASRFVNDGTVGEASSLSVKVSTLPTDEEDQTVFSFAGIIGTMEENTKLELSVENKASEMQLRLSGEDNLGLFCNTMMAGSILTVKSLIGKSDFVLSTANGHAGGLVGCMEEGAKLIVDTELLLTGTVNATGSGKAAGGLVGKAEKADIQLNGTVTVNETISAQGAACSGGYIGDATYSNNTVNLSLENYKMLTCTIIGGDHSGGLFGALKYSGKGLLEIDSIDINILHNGNSWQFGGLAGIYTTDDLRAELHILNTIIKINESGSTTAIGGLIGLVGDNASSGAVENASAAYISVEDVTATVDGKAAYIGGLVGEIGNSGHFLNLAGAIEIKNTSGTMGGTTAVGGLVGLAHSGVIRITGETDLSELRFDSVGAQYGQILGARGLSGDAGTLVYACGLGNGDGIARYGWKYVRPSSVKGISDIGNYGEVIRLDGTVLTEMVREGEFVAVDNIDSETEVISFYTDKHAVIPCKMFPFTNGDIVINSKRDFVLTSIMIQYGSTIAKGAFQKYGAAGNDLLNKNIIINAELKTLDLSDTGVVGLLRDDGSQVYNGIFEGNDCVLKLAAGQVYGSGVTDIQADAVVGSGQLYNHAVVGMLGIMNGEIRNVTLDGFIDFGMVNGGKETVCGSIAGSVSNAVVNHVTVKTEISYHTGASGGSIPNSYVGGFFGATGSNGNILFDNCILKNHITNSCTAESYYLGGYMGYVNHTDTIQFTDCGIKDAELTAEQPNNKNAMMGGVVAAFVSGSHDVALTNLSIDNLQVSNHALTSSGGLFGYQWLNTKVSTSNVQIQSSSVNTEGYFGGLVCMTSGYWKIGTEENTVGITFKADNGGCLFKGKTSAANPSALLIANALQSKDNTTYVELLKKGLMIEENSVTVTLTGGNYFDDLVGISKAAKGACAIVSIGLTDKTAEEAVLVNKDEWNTWKNQCEVNGVRDYINSKTRYYYNLDFYRQPAANDMSDLALNSVIDSEGDLLCWSVYVDAAKNIKPYFAKSIGGQITGTIDLTGVSFYPANEYLDINNAEITFAYEQINDVEISNHNRQLNDNNMQHYQMQAGLFIEIVNVITTNINSQIKWNVNGLKLKGTFGPYEKNKGGVLICSRVVGGNFSYKTIVSLNDIILDGIRCSDINKPLLINSIESYTTTSAISLHTTEAYTENKNTYYAASALIGTVGAKDGQGMNIDFSNIGLDARTDNSSKAVYGTYHTVFSKATFMEKFQYAGENSGGSYNFESDAEYLTLGKEISNTDSGRNNFSAGVTSQYCYFDTYGTTDGYVKDQNGPGTSNVDIADRFATGYLPYVSCCENYNSDSTYHELDINQKAYYIIDGCGTYGHPYQIKSITDENGNVLVSAEKQMMAISDILDGKGNGTVLCVNTAVLNENKDSADLHDAESGSTADVLYIKINDKWYHADKNGNRYQKKDDSEPVSAEEMLAYVRNAYYEIGESFELDMSRYNGIGGQGSTAGAFSGVLVGKRLENGEYPTITLTCPEGRNTKGYEVGGLIRYSQGSVVKNLNVAIESVSLTTRGKVERPTFFGGVIGWVIGGDNIIDNVKVSVMKENAVSITGNYNWLTAIGGYVGLVGSNDSLMGGGVVFRNISEQGLENVTYRKNQTDTLSVAKVRLETDGTNPAEDRYYWNPYVGRVLEGFACAEESTCEGMGDNTNKNYKIPKLNTEDKFSFEKVTTSTAYKNPEVVTNSTIVLDSAQDLWVLSSIVNSGTASRATNDQLKSKADGNNHTVSDAYYYGRARTGHYDGIGSVDWSEEDERDEQCTWGGKGEFWSSVTYLSTFTDNPTAVAYINIDVGYRQMTLQKADYDMRQYGNGFRGIGLSYYYDAAMGSGYFAQKLRMLRLAGNAVVGNGSSVEYKRDIYEYEIEPTVLFYSTTVSFMTRQAGLFNVYNQKNANGTVNNLSIIAEISSNQTVNRTKAEFTVDANRMNVAFGGFAGRTSYNYDNTLTFKGVDVTNTKIDSAYYAGGFIGKVVDYIENTNKYVFDTCKIDGVTITNSVASGGILGQMPRTMEIKSCTVKDVSIMARNENLVCYAGGLVGICRDGERTDTSSGGRYQGKIVANGATITNLEIVIPEKASTDSSVGGVVGTLAVANASSLNNVMIDNMKAVSRGYIGGLIGVKSVSNNKQITDSVSNTEVKNSFMTTTSDKYVGGFIGNMTSGALTAFNVRSVNNVIGYLITKNNKNQAVLDSSSVCLRNDIGQIDLEQLSSSNIGLREKNSDNYYWTYDVLNNDSSKSVKDCNVGIWVGGTSSKDVMIISASRIGDCSAVKNIGRNATANSYVIYADYTGTATGASKVNASPSSGITMSQNLTGDGVCFKQSNLSIGTLIINDTLAKQYNVGYFGANAERTMDALVSTFSEEYGSILSTYKTEETATLYTGKDIPILVLEMTSSAEINDVLRKYISILTNTDQRTNTRFVSMTPTTYVYENKKWVVAEAPSLVAQTDHQLKLNGGKYDNTKNQITIIDVVYRSPIADSKNTDVYHLYVPVLVKKVMDVAFDVKTVNGAMGYESAYTGENATLASFGEDFTAKLIYKYGWTAEAWNNAFSGGVNLLWSFDKQLNLDDLGAIDRAKIRLTLVDMNTHGTQKTFYQENGSVMADNGTVEFAKFAEFHSVPICDLLSLREEEGNEENPGSLKRVNEDDENATLRRWDSSTETFIYYAPKDEVNDVEGTVYYNVFLAGDHNADEVVEAEESYYLVVNCTEGQGMHNKIITLGTNKMNGEVPSRVGNKGNATYVLGDFYKISDMKLQTNGENINSTVMHSGSNDYIDVQLATDIAVESDTMTSYVNNRSVYFRYAVHMTDEMSMPVQIVAANTLITTLQIGSNVINRVDNLDTVEQGYVVDEAGSTTYITIKAKGSEFIGKTVTAVVRYFYDDGASLLAQFPVKIKESDMGGIKFQAVASMAYEYVSLGSTSMRGAKNDNKLYYTEEVAVASLNYDSYNIISIDGNTSQLGLNGKETGGASMQIRSRAIFDATTVSGLERNDSTSTKYPYYLEGTLSLGKKTETDKPNGGIGKTYEDVIIQNFLSDFAISCGDAIVDSTSSGLGIQSNGTYKFRICLTPEQVRSLLTDKVLINITYNVKTDALEDIAKGQYANYKVTLKTVLKNSALEELTNEPTDYMIYTNAKVYLGIIGVTDTDGE